MHFLIKNRAIATKLCPILLSLNIQSLFEILRLAHLAVIPCKNYDEVQILQVKQERVPGIFDFHISEERSWNINS